TTRADSAEAARRAWGARLAFDDWRKMIASPEIDAVAVVVRVPSHYAPTKAALEAGKHVYCEWPLGRTTAEAVELAALAKAKRLDTGTNTWLNVTSPDNVLISGRLTNGAVASVHIGAIPFAGSGYRMEIYGRDGTLVAAGEDSPQLSEVFLQGAKGGNTLAPIPV